MAGPNDMPLGACPKCNNMALISREGVKICPSCDTKSATKSGLVNKFQDPGDKMDKNGKMIGKAIGGVVQNDSKEVIMGQAQAIYIPNEEKNKFVEEWKKKNHELIAKPVDEVAMLIEKLDSLLANMKLSDFTDLREARKVMKYRKKLAVLKIELQDLLG